MNNRIALAVASLSVMLSSCTPPSTEASDPDMAIGWVKDSAEYRALSLQVYQMAALALPEKISDVTWSALPDQVNAQDLPPAVILDVDETALSNARFQAALVPPFRDSKLNRWSDTNHAVPVPGAVEFVKQAISAGVSVFFLTNRPCEPVANDPCPQKSVVISDLSEAGFAASEANVSLSYERPEWTKEKSIRRNHIAADNRVIMLFGDDLGDFIPCTRKRPLDPCSAAASRESRRALLEQYADYWGNGWYIMPNPMHGSWTSF